MVTSDEVSCCLIEGATLRPGEELIVSVECNKSIDREEVASCFSSVISGVEVCRGGDGESEDRYEAYSCPGDGTSTIYITIQNVTDTGMQFEAGTMVAHLQLVQGALSGVSDFRDAALQAVARISADHAVEGEFDPSVLSDRPIPAEHKFSRLTWIPIFYTMVAIFWGGINSVAVAARKGQETFGYAFRIVLVLENNLKVIAIHRASHKDILVREHTL
jgi:hypothetical protein